jgi:hypothetical protein
MGATSGNVTVTATNTCGTSTANSLAVTLNSSAPATPGVITGSTTACSGSAGNVYSITAVAGATSYTWTVPAGASITAGQGTISATVTMGATSGNITVIASSICGTSAANSLAVTLNSSAPATPGVITGSTTACSGSAGNVYSIVAVSGATSYTWTVPAGATITAGQGTISATVTLGAIAGNISVTASSTCGTSASSTQTITINTAPSTPGLITGSATACSGSAGNAYSIVAVSGATSYTWTVPAGATITSGQGTMSATVSMGATSGNVTVTATNSCGTSAASIRTVTINTISAVPGLISGATTLCSGSAGNVYSIVAVAGATSYTWSVPAGATITAGQGTISATVTMGSASGNVTVTSTNTCGTSAASAQAVTINTIPAVPGLISGSTTACSGSTGNIYSIVAVAGATGYTWTVPAGATITAGQGTISATVTLGATSGNIVVTASSACGTSIASPLAVAINTTPAAPGIINGTATICSGSTESHSILSVVGATNYIWTAPIGSIVTTGQGSTAISTNYGTTSGDITVSASNICGTSATSILPINVVQAPTVNVPTNQTLCSGDNSIPIVFSGDNASSVYSWTNDNPTIGLGASGLGDIVSFITSTNGLSNITVIPSFDGCNGQPISFVINVNPIPVVTLNNFSQVCANWAAFNLSGGSPVGGLYSGATVSGNSFDPITSGPGVFTLTYTVSLNGCAGFASSDITVDACAGINETENSMVLIYPNPTDGILVLEGELVSNYKLVELIDVSGRIVEQWSISNNKIQISIKDHSTGFYTIKLSGDKGELMNRIILK